MIGAARLRAGRQLMLTYLWIALGGALGSVSRYWLARAVASRFGESFPWGILVVNVSGSFVIGVLAAFSQPAGKHVLRPGHREFFMVGLCGGFTTFSSFSIQTFDLIRVGDWHKAAANAAGSLVLCLVAVWLGYILGTGLNPAKGNS